MAEEQTFRLVDENAPAVGQALRQTASLSTLNLEIERLDENADIRLILDFLENSSSLTKVTLSNWPYGRTAREIPVGTVRRLLRAISRSLTVTTLILDRLTIPVQSLPEILSARLNTLKIVECSCVSLTDLMSEEVKAAFEQNETISTIQISYVENGTLVPLLSRARLLRGLREVSLSPAQSPVSMEFSRAVGELLESSPHLNCLTLLQCKFVDRQFLPITQGIRNSASLRELSLFMGCSFDETSTKEFEECFKSHIDTLSLDYSSVAFNQPAATVLARIQSMANSSLKRVMIHGNFGPDSFDSLLQPLRCKSNLESLAMLHQSLDHDHCRVLYKSLPKFKQLKRISILLVPWLAREAMEWLMQAFWRNASLEEVTCAQIDGNDRALLDRICARNRGLHGVLTTPSAIPVSLWPRCAVKAAECDLAPSTMFAFLCARPDLDEIASKKKRACSEDGGVAATRNVRRKTGP